MKKQLIFAGILSLFLINSVLAIDSFSIRGDKEFAEDGINYKVHFSLWHSPGKSPSLRIPKNLNSLSNGISPQGQGSLEILAYNQYFRGILNLKFKETSSWTQGTKVYIKGIATGTIWVKGYSPIKVSFEVLYIYNTSTGKVDIQIVNGPIQAITDISTG